MEFGEWYRIGPVYRSEEAVKLTKIEFLFEDNTDAFTYISHKLYEITRGIAPTVMMNEESIENLFYTFQERLKRWFEEPHCPLIEVGVSFMKVFDVFPKTKLTIVYKSIWNPLEYQKTDIEFGS